MYGIKQNNKPSYKIIFSVITENKIQLAKIIKYYFS